MDGEGGFMDGEGGFMDGEGGFMDGKGGFGSLAVVNLVSSLISNPSRVTIWFCGQSHTESYQTMECTEYRVQRTVLQTLIEVMISCTHINTSLLKANEAKSREHCELSH
jgi:hypothetical protein